MRRAGSTTIVAVLIAIVWALAAATAAGDQDTNNVWTRALAATSGSDRWLPAETMMTMEFLDRKGETDEVLRMLTEVSQGESGLVVEMTELERPGGLVGALMPKDAFASDGNSGASASASAQPKEREAEEEGGGGNGELFANPFLPQVQDSLALESAGESRYFEGRRAEAYEISWVAGDDTAYQGTIWLADDTSEPVYLHVIGDSAQSNVKSLSVSVAYASHNATVLAERAVTSMEINFALLIKVRMRMTLDFADYFETDGEQEFTVVGQGQSP